TCRKGINNFLTAIVDISNFCHESKHLFHFLKAYSKDTHPRVLNSPVKKHMLNIKAEEVMKNGCE
ncbi:MAG TPA: hypothetical protein VN328_13645, partial [Thermodesulfovibrionales bacterium]|nr:hypothetical protein [Thermodesulfovibrionales bacterium]